VAVIWLDLHAILADPVVDTINSYCTVSFVPRLEAIRGHDLGMGLYVQASLLGKIMGGEGTTTSCLCGP